MMHSSKPDMLSPDSLSSWSFNSSSSAPSEILPETSTQLSEQFLRLRIGENTPVLLPIQQLVEVLTIPEHQIMPIPHLPAWVMGVDNWRGEILWMIDLGHLCGLGPWYQHPLPRSTHAAVVLNGLDPFLPTPSAKGQLLGLVVRQVEDLEWCNLDGVQATPATEIPSQLAQCSAGYWYTDEACLTILDGKKLLNFIAQSSSG